MSSDYLDKLVEYMAIQGQKHFNVKNVKYSSFHNLTNPGIIFPYQVYQNKEGIRYSANIYYWYYLCLILL